MPWRVSLSLLALFLAVPLQPQEKLSRPQCEEVTTHIIAIARQDPAHPLHPALKTSGSLPPEAIEAQIVFCMESLQPLMRECQLAATNLAELMACQESAAVPEKESVKPGPGKPPGQKPGPKAAEVPFFSEIKPARNIQVNATSCEAAYSHLLKTYRSAPALLALKNHQNILRSWESAEARQAFRNRCLKRFKSHDLGCMMDTNDPELIQVCLLNVPTD